MHASEAHRQIRSALRAELKGRHGQIGQIEADLSRSEGYLSRFCRGDMDVTLKGCLEALEALDVEPGRFFSAAFRSVTTAEELVQRLAGAGTCHRSFGSIEFALGLILDAEDQPAPARRRHRARLDGMIAEPIEVQLRRLRTAKKYRCEAFAEAYRRWLEGYRFHDPKGAVRLVAGAIQHIVPWSSSSRRGKLELLCRYLGTFASCVRTLDDLHTAFKALGTGLDLARREGFVGVRVDLLRRAGIFCSSVDDYDYEAGLWLLREAQEIAFDHDDQRSLGLVLVSKGTLQLYLDRQVSAARSYERGLHLLADHDDDEVVRYKTSAISGLVSLYTEREELSKARYWLTEAVSTLGEAGELLRAKLYWQRGAIERAAGDYDEAIGSFRQALTCLESGSVIDSILVSVELASTLLEAGRRQEAVVIAKGMASLTDSLRDNKLAQGALVEFLRIVLTEGVDIALLRQLRDSLQEKAPGIRAVRK